MSRPVSKGGSKRPKKPSGIFASTAPYRGATVQTVRSGEGAYRYPEGGGGLYSYTGVYASGVKSRGAFRVEGVFDYSGEFDEKGEITGRGAKSWTDGRSYNGTFVKGEMSGCGVWISADGTEIYEGEMLDNKRNGRGVLKQIAAGTTYSGDFKEHKMSGSGTFLKANSFIIESDNFINNIIDGAEGNKIVWNKTATYTGAISNGHLHGPGLYSTFDGTYEYEGEFVANKPEPFSVGSYTHLTLGRTGVRVFEPAVPAEPDPKKKTGAKAAAASTTSPDDPPLISLQPGYGGEIGDVIVRVGKQLSPDDILALQAAAAAAVPVAKGKLPVDPAAIVVEATPPPAEKNSVVCEKRRVFTVALKRLGGEVAPADVDSIDTSSLPRAPLWIRKKTLRDFAFAPTRLPPSAIAYIGSSSSASILCNPEMEKLLATSAIASREEYASDLKLSEGAAPGEYTNVYICDYTNGDGSAPTATEAIKCFHLALGSTISAALSYQLYPSAEREMSFFVDFCLRSPQAKDDAASRDVVVLSLQRTVDGTRESKLLQLMLAVPACGGECVWRLLIVTDAPPSESEEIPAEAATDAVMEEVCSWSHASSIELHSRPHSLCLCIGAAGVALTVDGDAKRASSAQRGEAAAAWLPSPEKSSSETAAEVSSEPAPAAPEAEPSAAPAPCKDARLLLCAGGSGFAGSVLLLAACSRNDRASAALVTGAYNAHADYEGDYSSGKAQEKQIFLASAAERAAAAAEPAAESTPSLEVAPPALTPYAYTSATHATVSTVCGAGATSDVFLPADAEEGLYAVEVSDCSISEHCQLPPEEAQERAGAPEDLEGCVRMVRRVGGARKVVIVRKSSLLR